MTDVKSLLSGAVIREIVDPERLNELGPGKPVEVQRARLEGLTPKRLLAPRPVKNRAMAEACLAGLWLWCDFLDQSHRISQDLATLEGSYWHAIMHRREPDYDNAKYWFRRVGQHPVYGRLASEARQIATSSGIANEAAFLATQATWDPYRFVDLCQLAASERGPYDQLCRLIQRREWCLLFDYCSQQAAG
jgi:hypothetical protein